jgi:hypothetical protein
MEPEFTERTDARGRLVICTYDGETGAARVDSRGLDDAKARAEVQARKKAEERGSA